MYPVSDAFLREVRSNTRKYFWTGTIVTNGGMTYEFGAKEIVKGSGIFPGSAAEVRRLNWGRCMLRRWGSRF